MKNLALWVVLIVLAVGGCSTRYRNAVNPSAGQTEFDRDWYQCKRENSHPAAAVAGSYASAGMEVDYSMAQSCMAARGWRPVKD
jgi:hypothetical protein